MDLTTTNITIKCSRFKACIILFAGIPLLSLVILLFVVIMISMPVLPKGTQAVGAQNLATIYLLFPLLVAGFSWVIWTMIRHREALFSTIQVSPVGIVVENSRYGVRLLNWNDVTHATYSRFGKMIILESPKLSKPLAVMNFGGRGLAPEFLAARTVIHAAVSNRWSEQRL
jgi:hypothetical protein